MALSWSENVGSSPRVRGAGRAAVPRVYWRGIIPACAGSSDLVDLKTRGLGDRPRVCGEQPAATVRVFGRWGSSPRVRGAAQDARQHVVLAGIIPACAGSSRLEHGEAYQARDHPRVCGEQNGLRGLDLEVVGSSPRVRGAVDVRHDRLLLSGIIPACAGSREGQSCTCRQCWDHPRVCGEQSEQRRPFAVCLGSSPRVRGAGLE